MVEISTNSGKIQVTTVNKNVNVDITKDYSQYYASVSKEWATKMNGQVLDEDYSSKYYASVSKDNKDATEDNLKTFRNESSLAIEEIQGIYNNIDKEVKEFDNTFNNSLNEINNQKNNALSDINLTYINIEKNIENEKSIVISEIEQTKTNVINDIQTEAQTQIENIKQTGFYMEDGKLYYTDENGEKQEFNSGGYNLFDVVKKDYILDFEESQGLALLGTYVYKTGISGSRYGYPDFVNKCIEEYNASEDYTILSNNIPQPTFTSNTTDGITISDARGNTTTLQTLFNNGLNQLAGQLKVGSWSTYWINIDYGQPTLLNSYTITSDNATNPEYPTDWTIQGSNDGVNFDTLGTYINQSWSSTGTRRTFTNGVTFNQTKPYSQYRLVFSAGVESSGSGELGGILFKAQKALAVKKNENGHIFYDIADKAFIDNIYDVTGKAWYYGVDEENERIFLPRQDFVNLTSKDKLKVYGNGNALPFDTGGNGLNYLGTSNSYNNSKPLYLSNDVNGTVAQNDTITITTSTAHGGEKHAYALATESSVNAVKASAGMVSESFANYADDIFYYYMVVGNTEQENAITDVVDVTTSENDTLPLFTAMHFDYKPNNASWLRGGQQVNSGGIYTFAYNELVNELTTPKYELKVIETANKVSGTDYSEYWEVNQEEMWFKTPISDGREFLIDYSSGTPITSGNKVVSNGVIAGCNASLSNKEANLYINNTLVSNARGGSTIQDAVPFYAEVTKGDVITFENMSKITFYPAKNKDTLYFKVANAVQNLEVMDAGAITEALADKIGRQECKAYVTETYRNGLSWYRVWSDGTCEQGGKAPSGSGTVVNLLKSYASTSAYEVLLQSIATTGTQAYACHVGTTSVSSFTIYGNTSGINEREKFWYAIGKMT